MTKAQSMPHEIWMAETPADAERAFDRFLAPYSAEYPKATECLAKDRKSLLAFYDCSVEPWVHLRPTNPTESSFATIRHRSERTRGCVSHATLLGLGFKLAMSAEKNWRRVRGFEYLPTSCAV
jgi:transposase-like protein